ncbi:MAG: tyrosine-type recombinase/integrase, partial [Luteimonas sp.]
KAKPAARLYGLFDGDGLYLELSPTGGKLWRWKYRYAGKKKRLALGTYPDTGLAAVRERYSEVRKALAAGIDPGEQRRAERAAGADRASNSFEVVAREWFGKQVWVGQLCAGRDFDRCDYVGVKRSPLERGRVA